MAEFSESDHVMHRSELLEKSNQAMLTDAQLEEILEMTEAIRLRKPDGKNKGRNEEIEAKIEEFSASTELSVQGNEMMAHLAELLKSSHTAFHLSEHAAHSLSHTGFLGAVIGSAIGIFTVPVLCAFEKRRPNGFEITQMALSLMIITLSSLALAAVGGPVATAAFILTTTVIGFGKTAFGFFSEWRERKSLEKEVDALKEKREQLVQDLEGLKNKDEITTRQVNQKISRLKEIDTQYVQKKQALQILQEKRTSRWELGKKGAYLTSSLLAIAGAALLLTPAAPVGLTMMVTAGGIASAILIGTLVVNRYKTYQAKKAMKKAKLASEKVDLLQDDPTLKPHSTEYKIASILSGGETKKALENEINNIKNDSEVPDESEPVFKTNESNNQIQNPDDRTPESVVEEEKDATRPSSPSQELESDDDFLPLNERTEDEEDEEDEGEGEKPIKP